MQGAGKHQKQNQPKRKFRRQEENAKKIVIASTRIQRIVNSHDKSIEKKQGHGEEGAEQGRPEYQFGDEVIAVVGKSAAFECEQ